MQSTSSFSALAYALRKSIAPPYNRTNLFHDLVAGLIVSLIALPLAMALSLAVGLPPQHGIYTAIVAGFVAALLGGSSVQVSGPTAAFVVILAPIIAQYGLHGLLIAEVMAGIFIIIMGFFKLGRFINYVPYPVVAGFTAGIAVVLATLSLNDFLGLDLPTLHGYFHEKLWIIIRQLPHAAWPEACVGIITLAILIFWRCISTTIPSSIIAVMVASTIAYLLNQHGFHVATIGALSKAPLVFHLPTTIPGQLYTLPSMNEILTMLKPAIVIALLAALESLLSAKAADGIAGTRHHPNAELLGIGIANICTAFFAGIPATGAIARTTANIKSGATSPIAAAFHGVLILLYILFLSPLIAMVPLAALSAILIITAYHMSHLRQCIHIIKIAPKNDVIVLLVCFLLTVFVDMVAGVSVGILCALLLFIKSLSEQTSGELLTSPENDGVKLPQGVAIFHIKGPLFFGTAFSVLEQTPFAYAGTKILIINLNQVPTIDMSALVVLDMFTVDIIQSGMKVICVASPSLQGELRKKLGKEVVLVDSIASAVGYAELAE